jgi:hypothetical protein
MMVAPQLFHVELEVVHDALNDHTTVLDVAGGEDRVDLGGVDEWHHFSLLFMVTQMAALCPEDV